MKAIQVPTMFLVSTVLATGLLAQAQPHSQKHPSQKQGQHNQGMMDDKMMTHCHEMMQKHEQMSTDMKAMDAKLDSMVASMNTTTGNEKTDAIAAIINEMVAQRKAMQEKMSSMQEGMMKHMMEHMQMGKKSMMMCPMMKGM